MEFNENTKQMQPFYERSPGLESDENVRENSASRKVSRRHRYTGGDEDGWMEAMRKKKKKNARP